MSSVSLKVFDPGYYHREYKNDIHAEPLAEQSWQAQCKRVGLVALPFLSLYKPLSFPLALVMGGLRTVTSISQLISALKEGNAQAIKYAMLQTAIAVIALTATIIAHPLGMLISTAHDLMIEVSQLASHLRSGEQRKAMENCLHIVSNALYLALFLQGGLGIALAFLAVQILLGLYHSCGEFRRGNYLEGVGHFAMAVIRGTQLSGQLKALQPKEPPKKEKTQSQQTDQTSTPPIFVPSEQQKVVQHGVGWVWGQSVTLFPNEVHRFPFCRHTITLVNETKHELSLHLSNDEGAPILWSNQQSPYRIYSFPNNRDSCQRFTDEWLQKQKGWAF
jgi:hypothetical protein